MLKVNTVITHYRAIYSFCACQVQSRKRACDLRARLPLSVLWLVRRWKQRNEWNLRFWKFKLKELFASGRLKNSWTVPSTLRMDNLSIFSSPGTVIGSASEAILPLDKRNHFKNLFFFHDKQLQVHTDDHWPIDHLGQFFSIWHARIVIGFGSEHRSSEIMAVSPPSTARWQCTRLTCLPWPHVVEHALQALTNQLQM